jgi:putative membrane protein
MARVRSGSARHHRLLDETGETERVILERALLDAERIMMQTVQTSLSLIGFGFTIAEFFSGAAPGLPVRPNARIVGEALLILGLLLLALGIWTHTQYRRDVVRELRRLGVERPAYGTRYLDTPSFIVAVLLLLIGFLILGGVVIRRAF